ncbi:nucleotidyltransferase domain protein [Methanobrevibacter cuticularis]|uniref:protein adenylyltransferase n=1 Tax=Methanobrevibacter cuticularis TaxID=47311 RepID=A0A166EU16_9EURY|nr:nucleotidyltransferase domain-containing protein [Methanobrevibacter cuticularis]KZX17012.1 nucleotidyltransferase domain protein [Methanobrevibacter cuticularis]
MDRKQLAIDFAKSLNHPEIEKIILFGSVARGDDTKDSDIDILILTTEKTKKIKKDIYSKASDILLETMEDISVKINELEHYQKYKDMPFYSNIRKEGVVIG